MGFSDYLINRRLIYYGRYCNEKRAGLQHPIARIVWWEVVIAKIVMGANPAIRYYSRI